MLRKKKTQFDQACKIGNCRVESTGGVLCLVPCNHEGNCKPEYKHWPFDTQNCTMHFGTWLHKGEDVDLNATGATIKNDESRNRAWKIVQVTVKKLRTNYSCCPDATYPSIKYSFALQRHSAKERAFILAPAIIFASVNLMALLLDPKRSERVALLLFCLLAHFSVMQQLSWYVPRNGDSVPTILTYVRDSLMITALLLLHTIIMRALMDCTAQAPVWIKKSTQTIRSYKTIETILSKDYLLQRTGLDGEGSEEAKEEVTIKASTTKEENTIWCTIVKVLDRLYFFLLVLVYIILMCGWVPASYEKFVGATKIVVIPEA